MRTKATTRSETVTVRVDPRLRYLAELAGRKQRRTLSSFIEWAIEQALATVVIGQAFDEEPITLLNAHALWDPEEADRFIKLALHYPDLLSHEESIRWKLIRECGYLWRGRYEGSQSEWTWRLDEDAIIWSRLRESWDVFRKVATGEAEKSALPAWQKTKPAVTITNRMLAGATSTAGAGGDEPPDGEIPF